MDAVAYTATTAIFFAHVVCGIGSAMLLQILVCQCPRRLDTVQSRGRGHEARKSAKGRSSSAPANRQQTRKPLALVNRRVNIADGTLYRVQEGQLQRIPDSTADFKDLVECTVNDVHTSIHQGERLSRLLAVGWRGAGSAFCRLSRFMTAATGSIAYTWFINASRRLSGDSYTIGVNCRCS